MSDLPQTTEAFIVYLIQKHSEDLQKALNISGNKYNLLDLMGEIASGRMFVYNTEDSMAICEIHQFPRERVMHIFLIAGSLQDIINNFESFKAWASDQGCSSISYTGRSGWTRALRKVGFKSTMTHGVCEFEKENIRINKQIRDQQQQLQQVKLDGELK